MTSKHKIRFVVYAAKSTPNFKGKEEVKDKPQTMNKTQDELFNHEKAIESWSKYLQI